MRILFTGDINFRGIEDLTKEASEEILSELKPYLAKVDFRIPNYFEEYLLNNTSFDRPSASRYDYGYVYELKVKNI